MSRDAGPQESRRELFLAVGRWLAAGALGLLAAALAWRSRRSGGNPGCSRRGRCAGCPALARCRLRRRETEKGSP